MLTQIQTCMSKGRQKQRDYTTYLQYLLHSFHNKLKTTYLNGKVNRRVDFLIDALLRIERDNFFSYMRRKQLFEINYQVIQETERHNYGMKIPPARVQVCLSMIFC